MSSEGKVVGQGAVADRDAASSSESYLTACMAELRKVTTPTRQEAMQATVVTLIIIAFMSVCLFLMDYFFHTVVSIFIGTV